MLVGEVREATSGTGSSWKLSGGSQLSRAVTKVSKNRQVLRAVRRRKASCPGFNSGARGSIGWLMRQAIQGRRTRTPGWARPVAGEGGAAGVSKSRPPGRAAGGNHMVAYHPAGPLSAARSASLAVCHSRSPLRVNSRRTSVRPMASRLRRASCGRKAKVSPPSRDAGHPRRPFPAGATTTTRRAVCETDPGRPPVPPAG